MSLFFIVYFSLMLTTLSAVPGWAKGIFIEPGARDAAMGSAMTAIADGPTAVYYNPAGLAQHKDSGVEASCFFLTDDAKTNKSMGNSAAPSDKNGDFPLQKYYPTEPSRYNSNKFSTNAQVPFVGGYKNVKGVTYALSVYGIGGGGGKWKSSMSDVTGADSISGSLDASYCYIIYNLSAAKEITPKISLGVGIDAVNMTNNVDVQKYYKKGAGSALPAFLGNYAVTMDESATGYGIQINGGMLYKFNDKMKGGLVLRSGTTIKMNGQAKLVGNLSDYSDDYTYPMTYAVGFAYEPKTNWTLALSLQQNDYSSMHETITYKNNIGLANSAGPLNGRNWNDTTQVHIGAEYRCAEKLALRAGLQNDPAPFSQNQLTLSEINQYNFIYYSIGVGYKVGNVNLDFCYAYCPSDNPSEGGRDYTYNLDVFRLGARYNF